MERAVPRERRGVVLVVGPGVVGVEDGDVGDRTGRKGAPVEPQELRRIDGQHLDDPGKCHGLALMQEDLEEDRKLRLETEHAEGSAVEFHLLLIGCVGGMVAGQDRDGAVGDAGDDLVDVGRGPQWRIHLEIGVEGLEPLVGQGDVMRADLGGDRHSSAAGITQQTDTARGADVLAVDGMSGLLGKQDVPRDDEILGKSGPTGQAEAGAPLPLVHDPVGTQGRLLAMIHDREAELAGIFNRTAHHAVILDATAVVGEGHDAGIGQGTDRRHLLPRKPACDGPGAVDIDDGRGGRPLLNPGDRGGTVGHGRGVGHADDGREATRRCTA